MVLLQCSCLLTLHCFLRELQEAGVALQKVKSRVRHFGMVFVFLVVKATLAVLGWYCRLPAASDGSSAAYGTPIECSDIVAHFYTWGAYTKSAMPSLP